MLLFYQTSNVCNDTYKSYILAKRVISMKMAKDMAFMALGAGAVLAYQKYNKPVKKQVHKIAKDMEHNVKNIARQTNDKLEDMM